MHVQFKVGSGRWLGDFDSSKSARTRTGWAGRLAGCELLYNRGVSVQAQVQVHVHI
jgi:hypothetical protein